MFPPALLRTDCSLPVALHLVSPRRSYFPFQTAELRSDGDLHPVVQTPSQARERGIYAASTSETLSRNRTVKRHKCRAPAKTWGVPGARTCSGCCERATGRGPFRVWTCHAGFFCEQFFARKTKICVVVVRILLKSRFTLRLKANCLAIAYCNIRVHPRSSAVQLFFEIEAA
jgi:hypothetical protein